MTITASAPNATDWLALANDLASDFATRAADHDANDTFVAENYAKLREAKLFSAPVPADLGGGGATFAQNCAIIRTVARGCGSTALAYSMHSHLLQGLNWRHRHGAVPPAEPLLRRIAKEELILISTGGSDWLDGSGTLTKENGSYTFKARKIFGSGSPSGDLLLTTGVYEDPEKGPTVLHFGSRSRKRRSAATIPSFSR
jgi:alkylation response protein AidB-like acyl-CoA dehydrogenase